MRKKLLLADDSITIQKVVELTFPSDEFEVVTAGNGRLAVDKAATFLPDVVLCDVIMPQLDGYQVCEALRAIPELKDVPILLLNGAFEPYDAERALSVGALGNVSKPFDPPALVTRVKEILAEHASAAYGRPGQAVSLDGSEGLDAIEEDPRTLEAPVAETLPHEPAGVDYAYDESETAPVSTIEVPLGIREMAARSLSLDAPVFAEPEPEVLNSEAELSDFSETLHGPLGGEPEAIESEPMPAEFPAPVSPALPEALTAGEAVAATEEIEMEPVAEIGEELPAMAEAENVPEPMAPEPFEAEAATPDFSYQAPEAGLSSAAEEVSFAPEPLPAFSPESAPEPAPEPSPEALPEPLPESGTAEEPVSDAIPESLPEPITDFGAAESEAAAAETEEEIAQTLPPTFPARSEVEAGPAHFEPEAALEPEDLPASAPVALTPEAEIAPSVDVQADLEPAAAAEPAAPAPPEIQELPAVAVPAAPVVMAAAHAEPPPIPVRATDTAAGAFDGLVGPEAPPTPASSTGGTPSAEVAVPVDMVQQIAQRVISQVSERVIREIAWEVIPVIAEKLVKAEIERIKARAESERD